MRHYGDTRGTGGYSRKWSACVPNEISEIVENWNQLLKKKGKVSHH